MVEKVLRGMQVDRLAIMLSGACLLHCVLSVVALGALSSAAMWLTNPLFHEVGLGLAIGFGAIALVGGVMLHGGWWPLAIGGIGLALMTAALLLPHGPAEIVLTVAGVMLVAIGHLMNRRALG